MIIIEFAVIAFLTVYCTMLVVWSFPQKKMFNFGNPTPLGNEIILLKRIAELERKIYDFQNNQFYPIDPRYREITKRGISVTPIQASIHQEIRPMGLHRGNIDIIAMHKDRIAYQFGKLIANDMIQRNQIDIIELDYEIIFKANYLSII